MLNNGIKFYTEWLDRIMEKYGLKDGLIHSTYKNAMENKNLNHCYIGDRVTVKNNKKQFRKELAELLDTYFKEFPEAIKPFYSYH